MEIDQSFNENGRDGDDFMELEQPSEQLKYDINSNTSSSKKPKRNVLVKKSSSNISSMEDHVSEPVDSPVGSSEDEKKEEDDNDDEEMKQMILDLEIKRKSGYLTFKEAAIYILYKSQRLMTAIEITEEALKQELFVTGGKTPHNSISSQLNTDIAQNKGNSIFAKFGAGRFSIKSRLELHMTQNIITPQEQKLGMILLKGSSLPYIPFESECNWLEVKPSQLINGGMGLYAKHNIQDKMVFSEYKGRIRDIEQEEEDERLQNQLNMNESPSKKSSAGGDAVLHPYGVSVIMPDGSTKMVDGLDEDENVLSLAPRANDAGPLYNNCILAEYSEHPGRVFLESIREIKAGEEIFVSYGPSYWNIPQYPYFPDLRMYGYMPQYSRAYQNKICQNELMEIVNNNYNSNSNSNTNNANTSTNNDTTYQYSCKSVTQGGTKLLLKRIKI